MGWAARAKVRSGNPTQEVPTFRFINSEKLNASLGKRWYRGKRDRVLLRFSDRAYTMDDKGVLRRASAEEQVAATSSGHL